MADLEIDIVLARRSFELCAALTLGAETVAIVGPSGAGKTSLLRAVAGLERSCAGRTALGAKVWLDSEHGVRISPERRRVGYLPQDYGLFPHLSVAENISFAARRERPDLLERLDVGHLARARPHELSGGERQRVALARALGREPEVLLLDEPFGALDPITRRQVRDELGQLLTELGLPTLVVTHAFEDASALAGRIGVLDAGRLVQLAPAGEMLAAPASVLVAALCGANVLPGMATPSSSGSVVALDGGGELTSTSPAGGPVTVAVYPWGLEVVGAADGTLTDTVLDVHPERGGWSIRCSRLTVIAPERAGWVAPGAVLGLRAAPADVHLIG